MMDTILEIPMSQVMESISLDNETKAVLLGGVSCLRPLYKLMLAHESGEWEQTAELSRSVGLSESEVAELYWQAMQWARQMSSA